jgi:uncharacterized protein (TIGR00369 family)
MDKSISDRLKLCEDQYFTQTHSAAGKWLNYKLLKVEAGEIKASILVRDEMTNPNKNLHGGMYAMICDELSGLAFFSLGLNTFYTTVNLHVDFLMSAPLASEVIIHAKVTRHGKRIGHVICDLYNVENKHLAHSTTNLVNTNKEIFALT